MTAGVRWGVVGCGWVTREHAVPALRSLPGASLTAVCDRDRGRAAALAGPARVATDVDELLAPGDVDAVYVATPHDDHAATVTAVAAHGVAVLCEKPMATSHTDARAVVTACRGRLAGTAFDQRFHPAHRRIAEIVAEGGLGTVTAVRIVYGCWLPPEWSPPGAAPGEVNWRADPVRAGGGASADLAPHGVDLVGVLLDDDLVALEIMRQHRVHPYPVDDGSVLVGRTGGGVLFSGHVSFNTGDALPRRSLHVVGTAAQLVAEDTMGQTAGGTLTRIDARTGARSGVDFDTATDPFTAQLAAYTAAVAGTTPWPFPLDRDLRLHRLLDDAMTRSADR
ncbi:MAG: Gfo/Idh/MocA family oxidoreductase [Pseudonocardia sediminis]